MASNGGWLFGDLEQKKYELKNTAVCMLYFSRNQLLFLLFSFYLNGESRVSKWNVSHMQLAFIISFFFYLDFASPVTSLCGSYRACECVCVHVLVSVRSFVWVHFFHWIGQCVIAWMGLHANRRSSNWLLYECMSVRCVCVCVLVDCRNTETVSHWCVWIQTYMHTM